MQFEKCKTYITTAHLKYKKNSEGCKDDLLIVLLHLSLYAILFKYLLFMKNILISYFLPIRIIR